MRRTALALLGLALISTTPAAAGGGAAEPRFVGGRAGAARPELQLRRDDLRIGKPVLRKAEEEGSSGERYWHCVAHGRVEARIWADFDGYGPGRDGARRSALERCGEIAQGCTIRTCSPGL